jgi:hypothetical protein
MTASIRDQLVEIIKERTAKLAVSRKVPNSSTHILSVDWEALGVYDVVDHIMDITGTWRLLADEHPREDCLVDLFIAFKKGHSTSRQFGNYVVNDVVYMPGVYSDGDWRQAQRLYEPVSPPIVPKLEPSVWWRYHVDPDGKKMNIERQPIDD